MSSPSDTHRILHDCMLTIEGASNAMAVDMNDAAMKLGAASMMLASASHAAGKHAAEQRWTRPAWGGDSDRSGLRG